MTPSIKTENQKLEEMVGALRKRPDSSQARNLADGINSIIYNAIVDHPVEVNAVNVSVNLDSSRNGKGLSEGGHGREIFERFLSLSCTNPSNGPVQIYKNLPFSHGMGTREAHNRDCGIYYSIENVKISQHHEAGRSPSFLEIDMADHGSYFETMAQFYLDEVQLRLVLVPNSALSPLMKLIAGTKDRSLEPAMPSEAHYMKFRGFYPKNPEGDRIPRRARTEEFLALLPHIWTPNSDSGMLLWKLPSGFILWPSRNYGTFSGFAADLSGKEPVLYEFNQFPMPRILKDTNPYYHLFAIHAILQCRDKPTEHVQVYTGRDIVQRLAQVQSQAVLRDYKTQRN